MPRSSRCKDLVDIIKAMTVASAAFVVAMVLLGFHGFPRSIIAINWLASITARQRSKQNHSRPRSTILGICASSVNPEG